MRYRQRKKTNTEALERELTSLEKNLLTALQERLGQIDSSSVNKSAEFMDTVSNSELDEFNARLVESDSTKIDEIEEALQRLREDKYGICKECEKNISRKRLKARPFATLCLECKQRAEQDERHSIRSPHPGGRGEFSSMMDEGTSSEFQTTYRGDKF